MEASLMADVEPAHQTDMSEPIRCAVAFRPTPAQKHKKEMLRYLVLVIALVAVILLIAIALYYTKGNSVTIEHVSSLAPQAILRA